MSKFKMFRCKVFVIKNLFDKGNNLVITRCGHTLRGKAPGIARTLDQRLSEGQSSTEYINIGFPQIKCSKSESFKERLNHIKAQRNNSTSSNLKFDLLNVRKEWLTTSGPFHLKKIAEHYGIYKDLFGDGYFVPRVDLKILYKSSDDSISQVFNGNVLTPSDAQSEPDVNYDHVYNINKTEEQNSLWTLILTNPDGNLTEKNKEQIHWFIGNIPNNEINKGETIVPYLQPIPPKGTGYHRHIFILYKQEKKIDFTKYKINTNKDLAARKFESLKFYELNQDDLTPAGLAFFQSTWEKELTKFYHNYLEMQEPRFEYDFPKAYIKDQKWFPLKEPFNLYMDKYRDQKQVATEYLEKKLAKTQPFTGPEKQLKYPNAHPFKPMPSWLRTEIKKNRLKWGRINDI